MRIRSKALAALAAVALAWIAPASSVQALEIFACEPEWAALAKVLAPQAKITAATHARQDPHYIEARPALIGALRRADLAVCTGASLEVGWLPMLQQRAGNPKVRDGRDGMFYAASAVQLIDVRERVDRSMGDVHAEGNPHFHLDPRRLKQVAAALAERLARIDPERAVDYRQRYLEWSADWDRRIQGWEQKARPLSGRTVVAQHSTFAYLWGWLGVDQTADLEPKPGVPPTVAHLQQVLQQVQGAKPMAVVQTLYQDPQAGRWLVERVRIPLLALPSTVTAEGATRELPALFDTLIDALLQSARSTAPR